MVDPNMGLQSSQVLSKLWGREQSDEQLKNVLKLIFTDSFSIDRLTETRRTTPSTKRWKFKQYHIKATLREFLLHNEVFHILLGLFLSMLGWGFELSSNGSSMNMFNFIALTIYLPIFLNSNVLSNKIASLTKASKRTGNKFSRVSPLKDVMLQSKIQPASEENSKKASLLITAASQADSLLIPEGTVPVPAVAESWNKPSRSTKEATFLNQGTFTTYSKALDFQAWKPTRLQKHSDSLIDLETGLHDFILRSFGSFLTKIRNVSPPNYLTIRNGAFMVVEASALVVGDVIVLTEGQIVPCDCTILPTYFTQAHSLPAHFSDNQMYHSIFHTDISSRLRPFCPEAVSYGLARSQPSVHCLFPTATAARIIAHYKIHSAYSTLHKSRARYLHKMEKIRSTDPSSTIHSTSLFYQDASEELAASLLSSSMRRRAGFGRSLLESNISGRGRSTHTDPVSNEALSFYIKELGLQESVQDSSLLCGYKISHIRNALPITLEDISVPAIVSAFLTHVCAKCQTEAADFSAEEFARLSSLCMKTLIEELDARKTSTSSVSIDVTRGIQACVTALGRDTSVFQRSERLLLNLQQSLDIPVHAGHILGKKVKRMMRAKRNISNPATIIEGKEALAETISMPASFLSSTLSMQGFFRVISIISLWISALLIIIPVLPRIALSSDLRNQYLDYWNPAHSNQLALFTIGFIPAVCAALTFGLISGLFLHRNIVSLRPIISVSSKYLLSLIRRNVHIHTLGALEAVGFTNALVIDESLLVNISGSQVHKDAPGFWGPVTMNLSFIYVAGENTSHRLYLDDELRLQRSILAQDVVTPLWPSMLKHLVQVDTLTGQYVIIGARRKFHKNNALQHSKGAMESTEQIEHSHQFSFYEGQHADIALPRESKVSNQSRRLYDTLLCLMRFLACVTMAPADVAYVLRKSTTSQTIFSPDYAFEIIASNSESLSSRSTSHDCSFPDQKGAPCMDPKQHTNIIASPDMNIAKSPPIHVELSFPRPIKPEGVSSNYFTDFEEHLCKYLTMRQAWTLKSIRASQCSAITRTYGHLITPGCLQDSHLSVSQVHPLLTYPLDVYLVYIERHIPVVVVKSSSPGDLISACNYAITDALSLDTKDIRYHPFTLAGNSDNILFYYRKMDDARRQLAIQQINELGTTCHELVVYAISALYGEHVDMSSFSNETVSSLDLIYIGAMGFRAKQKQSPVSLISRFTDIANGANLVITTRRSSNITGQHVVSGASKFKGESGPSSCTNPITNMQTLLNTLSLTVQRNTRYGKNNPEEVRESDWITSNAEMDKLHQDINFPTVELKPLLSSVPTKMKKTKDTKHKQPITIASSAIQAKRCFVTSDLEAVGLYTLSKTHDNGGKPLLLTRPNRRHKQLLDRPALQQRVKEIVSQDKQESETSLECSNRYLLAFSDTEEEQESSQQDARVFHATTISQIKYQQRSVQLARNRRMYARLKATRSESFISDESCTSDDILRYPIIAPQQTWKVVEHFMQAAQKLYNPPKRNRRRAPIREGDMLNEFLPNIFIIPESSSVDVASALSNVGAFVTLVLPSRPSSCAYTVEEDEVFKDNATAAALLQTAGDSKAIPSYLSVWRSNVSFSRKPDFLVIGYNSGDELKCEKRQMGIPRESYMQLRSVVKERISIAYIFGHRGLQHLRDVALEAPHFFLSIFPVFIGAVRSNLIQGIFPLTLALTIIINVALECKLYKYEMINLGLRPWYYPPTTVGIILLTNALVNDFMIPKVLQFALKLHGTRTVLMQMNGRSQPNSFTQSEPLVKQMISRFHETVIKMNRQQNAHKRLPTTVHMRQSPNRYHLEVLMNVAEKLSKNLQTSSLVAFAFVFIITSAIALIPSISYRYYGSAESFKPAYFEVGGLFVSSLSRKFVTFATLLMVLLFMSFSIAAFFITTRLSILRNTEDSMHRCLRVFRVGLFFAFQFLIIYAVLLLPVRFPILSLLISGFRISEETVEFWNSIILSAGISCLVFVGIILEQSIPILE